MSNKINYDNNPERRKNAKEFLSSEEIRLKRESGLRNYWENIDDERLKEMSDQGKRNWNDPSYREKQSRTRASQEYKDKMSSYHPGKGYKNMYNKELDLCKKVKPEEVDDYLLKGYILGTRPRSDETRRKCSISALNRKSKKEGDSLL